MAIVETFKKGQLVPKRLGILFTHKKVRYTVIFNTNVKVIKTPNNSTVYVEAYPEMGESVFLVKRDGGRKRKNGTMQKKGLSIVFDHIFYVGKGNTIAVPNLDDVKISPKAVNCKKV